MVLVLICFDYIFTEFYEERVAFIDKCFFLFKLNIDNLEMCMFKKFPIDRSTGGRVLEKVRAWSKQTHIYLQGKPLSLRTGKMCL